MLSIAKIWQTQCNLWGNAWGATTALWGVGVSGVALVRWQVAEPVPLVSGLLLASLLGAPVIRLTLRRLAAHEPVGPRGRAWLVWHLAGVMSRPPMAVLLSFVEALAFVGAPALLLVALTQMHPALAVFAVVPSLWRNRIVRALTAQGG
jgi:hypothetical protein